MNECTRCVMIVDDDHDVREALREVLQDNGYTALEAGNGEDALALLRTMAEPPCVILLDIMMPVMDGWQFRAAQRAEPALAAIPVVVLTAHGSAERVLEGMDVAIVLKKPVQLPPLLATVARFCAPT